MKMLDSRDDFAHVVGGSTFTESFTLYNFVEKFASCRELHDDMYISEINIASMEFDDVWMVKASQDF